MLHTTLDPATELCQLAPFYYSDIGHFTYVIFDPGSRYCAVIDCAANYRVSAGKLTYEHAEKVLRYIESRGLTVEWILETQLHTQYFSASGYIRNRCGGKLAISEQVAAIAEQLQPYLPLYERNKHPERFFDKLLSDADQLTLGKHIIDTIATPGHNLSSMTYSINQFLFTGKTLLLPDVGVGDINTPFADPERLFASLSKLLARPGDQRTLVGLDWPTRERAVDYETSIDVQRRCNIDIAGIDKKTFIRNKTQNIRDNHLPYWPALQWNLRGGCWPIGHQFYNVPVYNTKNTRALT